MDDSDKTIKELHIEAVTLLARKCSDDAIISALMKKGIKEHYAETILQNAKEDKSDKVEFYRHLFSGLFVFGAGLHHVYCILFPYPSRRAIRCIYSNNGLWNICHYTRFHHI
jgi:hypothetical protein